MIARAVEREAARLAAHTGPSPLVAPSAQRQARSGPSDWSRVLTLKRGTEIILTTARSPLRKHRLLKADEAGLTILNVADPTIPSTVSGVLVSTARNHPEYFDDMRSGRQFELGKGVRLGPDGVFQDDRKLFDIAHVIESVPRDDVVEVSVLAKHIGGHAKRGALIGAAIGATVLGTAAASCKPGSEPGYCDVAGGVMVGALGGAAVGFEYGAIIGIFVPRSPNVIYRR